jgi:hypothetical protein
VRVNFAVLFEQFFCGQRVLGEQIVSVNYEQIILDGFYQKNHFVGDCVEDLLGVVQISRIVRRCKLENVKIPIRVVRHYQIVDEYYFLYCKPQESSELPLYGPAGDRPNLDITILI